MEHRKERKAQRNILLKTDLQHGENLTGFCHIETLGSKGGTSTVVYSNPRTKSLEQ